MVKEIVIDKIPKIDVELFNIQNPIEFDESITLIEKINNIITYINMLSNDFNGTLDRLQDITDEQYDRIQFLSDDFHKIKLWVENIDYHLHDEFDYLEYFMKGYSLTSQTISIIYEWLENGKMIDIISNKVFHMLANKIDVDMFIVDYYQLGLTEFIRS